MNKKRVFSKFIAIFLVFSVFFVINSFIVYASDCGSLTSCGSGCCPSGWSCAGTRSNKQCTTYSSSCPAGSTPDTDMHGFGMCVLSPLSSQDAENFNNNGGSNGGGAAAGGGETGLCSPNPGGCGSSAYTLTDGNTRGAGIFDFARRYPRDLRSGAYARITAFGASTPAWCQIGCHETTGAQHISGTAEFVPQIGDYMCRTEFCAQETIPVCAQAWTDFAKGGRTQRPCPVKDGVGINPIPCTLADCTIYTDSGDGLGVFTTDTIPGCIDDTKEFAYEFCIGCGYVWSSSTDGTGSAYGSGIAGIPVKTANETTGDETPQSICGGYQGYGDGQRPNASAINTYTEPGYSQWEGPPKIDDRASCCGSVLGSPDFSQQACHYCIGPVPRPESGQSPGRLHEHPQKRIWASLSAYPDDSLFRTSQWRRDAAAASGGHAGGGRCCGDDEFEVLNRVDIFCTQCEAGGRNANTPWVRVFDEFEGRTHCCGNEGYDDPDQSRLFCEWCPDTGKHINNPSGKPPFNTPAPWQNPGLAESVIADRDWSSNSPVGAGFLNSWGCCGDEPEDCALLKVGSNFADFCVMNGTFQNSQWHSSSNNRGDIIYAGCYPYTSWLGGTTPGREFVLNNNTVYKCENSEWYDYSGEMPGTAGDGVSIAASNAWGPLVVYSTYNTKITDLALESQTATPVTFKKFAMSRNDPSIQHHYICDGIGNQSVIECCGDSGCSSSTDGLRNNTGEFFTKDGERHYCIDLKSDTAIDGTVDGTKHNKTFWHTDLDWTNRKNCESALTINESGDIVPGNYRWTGTLCCGEADDAPYFETYHDRGGVGTCWNNTFVPNTQFLEDNTSSVIVFNGTFYGCAIDERNPNRLSLEVVERGLFNHYSNLLNADPNKDYIIKNKEYLQKKDFPNPGGLEMHGKEDRGPVFVGREATSMEDRTNMEYCTILGNDGTIDGNPVGQYFCSYKGTWNETGGKNLSHLSFVEWEVDDSVQRAECCQPTECWNGTMCIPDQSDRAHEPPQDDVHGGHRCIMGEWVTSDLKWTRLKEGELSSFTYGWCPSNDQCLVNPFGVGTYEDPICINNTEYIGDFYCNDGLWTSRTKLVAERLLSFVEDDYVMVCGDYKDVLNYYSYRLPAPSYPWTSEDYFIGTLNLGQGDWWDQFEEGFTPSTQGCDIRVDGNVQCINKMCLLVNPAKGNPEDIYLGVSINHNLSEENNFLKSLGMGLENCGIIDPDLNDYKNCEEGISYNPYLGIVVKDLGQASGSPRHNLIDLFTSIFSSIMAYIRPTTVFGKEIDYLTEAQNFKDFYMLESGDKRIFAIREFVADKDPEVVETWEDIEAVYQTSAEYHNFETDDICEAVLNYNALFNRPPGINATQCEKIADTHYVFYLARNLHEFNNRGKEFWKGLTTMIRLV